MPTLTPFLDPVNASPMIRGTDLAVLLFAALAIGLVTTITRFLRNAFAAAVQLVVTAFVVGLVAVVASTVAIAVGYAIALNR